MSDELLEEQKAYYRGRAPYYDDWWQHRGRYDRDPEIAAAWDTEIDTIAEALTRFDPSGDVLELAGGTGWWTERLTRTADTLTVVDSSPEALALNRRRVSTARHIVADVFEWQPDRTYDVVFFSFWISHVPRARFDDFWRRVDRCLNAAGRTFFIDNRHDPLGTGRDPYVRVYGDDVHIRTLNDGTEHRVVKIMYEPGELQRLLEERGWDADITGTRWFVYGSAQKSSEDSSGTV
jgi:ubiquinone/menaquinone biosynthesis C-methylase UbiE